MSCFKPAFWQKILAFTLVLVIASFLAFSFMPAAQAGVWEDLVALFTPPDDAPPTGRSSGGAGRGPICTLSEEALKNQDVNTLMALVPVKQANVDNHPNQSSEVQVEATTPDTALNPGLPNSKMVGGYTIAAQPTFWFYLPYTLPSNSIPTSNLTPEISSNRVAQFVLLDDSDRPVWNELMNVELHDRPRLVEYPLPYSLETGKLYNWYFSILCDSDKLSRNPTVRGWVQRVEPTPDLQQALRDGDASRRFQQYEAYADDGIWFDTVSSLVDTRRQFSFINRDLWTGLLTYFEIPDANQLDILESAVPTEREVVNGNQLPARMYGDQ